MSNPNHYSGLKEFIRCNYLYHLSNVEAGNGIELFKDDKSQSLFFGSVFHGLMEELCKRFESKNAVNDAVSTLKITDKNNMTPAMAASIPFMVYSVYKHLEKDIIPEVKFFNNRLNFYGKVDGYAPATKTLYEFKTSKRIDKASVFLAKSKVQDRIYAAMLSEQGMPVHKIKHIIVGYPSHLKMLDKETQTDFNNKVRRKQVLDSESYIHVEEVALTEDNHKDTCRQLEAILRTIDTADMYFKNTDACMMYGRLCDYHPLCSEGFELPYVAKEKFNFETY